MCYSPLRLCCSSSRYACTVHPQHNVNLRSLFKFHGHLLGSHSLLSSNTTTPAFSLCRLTLATSSFSRPPTHTHVHMHTHIHTQSHTHARTHAYTNTLTNIPPVSCTLQDSAGDGASNSGLKSINAWCRRRDAHHGAGAHDVQGINQSTLCTFLKRITACCWLSLCVGVTYKCRVQGHLHTGRYL